MLIRAVNNVPCVDHRQPALVLLLTTVRLRVAHIHSLAYEHVRKDCFDLDCRLSSLLCHGHTHTHTVQRREMYELI
jgi:hypothetical protein